MFLFTILVMRKNVSALNPKFNKTVYLRSNN